MPIPKDFKRLAEVDFPLIFDKLLGKVISLKYFVCHHLA